MDEDDVKRRGLLFTGSHFPYNPDLVERAKEMRKSMTTAEKKLWYHYLRNCSFRFRRQHPIDHYIVDFYCATLKLVVEIDGERHSTEGGICYDAERDAVLASYGLKVLRFSNTAVMNDFESVCTEISTLILDPPRLRRIPPDRGDARKAGW